MKDNYEIQTHYINKCISNNSANKLEIAMRIQHIIDLQLFVGHYHSIYEYAEKEFNFDRRRVSECKSIVYKFCEKRQNVNQYSSGYCVKSLFRDYKYCQLYELIRLTEEEIINLKINSDMSVRQIRKIVRDYFNNLSGDSEDPENNKSVKVDNKNVNDYIVPNNDTNINPYNLKYADMTFSMDNCFIKSGNKKLSTIHGLNYFRDMILSNPDYEFIVIKTKKKEN